MASSFHHRRGARRFLAALVTVSMGTATAAAGAQPAAAEAVAPWLTVSDGFASFAVPAEDIQNTMGTVSSVVVEGNFGPSFNLSDLGLGRSGNSTAWTSMIGPLPPGLYYYRLRGDGTKIVKDSTNPTSVTSEPTWSTFLVPGHSARYLADVAPGQGGKTETITYAGGTATVWTPPGYDADRRRPYPVLYLLPGEGGGHADWAELGRAGQILDNLSVQRRIEPMVVVMSDVDDVSRSRLPRAIDRKYNVTDDARQQAIAGASAGGVQAVRTALTRSGSFAYVGSFGGVFADERLRVNAKAVNATIKLLRLYTGNLTDPAYNPTYRMLRKLDAANVRHEFDGVNPDAGHNWKAWQENLVDFAPRLFRPVHDHRPSPGHLVPRHEFKPPAPGTTPTPWLTREVNGDTFVTAETGTEFAGAKRVTLWGNWAPGGSWVNVPLTRVGDRWRVTVGPLKPWFYYYKFVVDLASKKDTSNPTSITTEPTWSSFLVRGKASRLLADVPARKGGTVNRLTYQSTVAGEERSAYVWTPPGYDPARPTPYPVFYLQHGGGQNYTDWLEMGRAKQILDNEFLDGSLVPMVVVMGNGNVPDFPKELLENIVPAARAGYHISDEPARQALAGLSMGGFQTFDVLKKHPGEFAYIGAFSAGISFSTTADPTGYDPTAINNGTKLLRIYTGNVTDFTYPITMASMAAFDRVGIRYEFAGVTPGPHGWDTWQKNLIDFAPRLFRSDAS